MSRLTDMQGDPRLAALDRLRDLAAEASVPGRPFKENQIGTPMNDLLQVVLLLAEVVE